MAVKKKPQKTPKRTASKAAKPGKKSKRLALETFDAQEKTSKQICDDKIDILEKEVRILREVSAVTNKDFEINKILDRFLEIVMEATGADAGSLLLVDKLSDTLDFIVARGQKAAALKGIRLKLGEGIAGWVAQTGKPLITPDVKKDPRFSPRVGNTINYQTRNIMCVPLKFEDDILGVVEFLNKKGDEVFSEYDLELIQSFTGYIAVIIKNAQLFMENKNKIHRLEHLMDLTKYVNSTLNLNTLLDVMLQISTNTLNAEAGSILLLDEDGDELIFSAATGAKADKLKDIRVPVGEGIAGWVARESKSVLITDAQNDPRFFRKADQKTDFKTKSIIAVPIKTKNKLIGVAEVLNKKNNEPFNEEDVSMLEALSNQAAIAIENAKLYANLRELFLNTVRALATAIETKDVYTRGHSERVTMFAELIASELNFTQEEIENLNLAGLLHDIGKIGIDDSILRKPSKLTPAEFDEIKKHPAFAANILETIPQLKHIIPAVRHHHERYDGNGYPDGLKGENIPYYSRIIGIADTFDAMSSSRPYRAALPFNVCLDEVKRCAGTQFDPELANVAQAAFKKWHDTMYKTEKEK